MVDGAHAILQSFCRLPVHIAYDSINQLYRADVYDGIISYFWNVQKGWGWYLFPSLDASVCWLLNLDDMQEVAGALPLNGLVDLGGATYAGTAQLGKKNVQIWQRSSRSDDIEYVARFFTTAGGRPIRYTLSIPTDYIVDYGKWTPGPVAEEAFDWPESCYQEYLNLIGSSASTTSSNSSSTGRNIDATLLKQRLTSGASNVSKSAALSRALRVASLLPVPLENVINGVPAPQSAKKASRAAATLAANTALVRQHNRCARDGSCLRNRTRPSYTLKVNPMAQLTPEEFRATRLGLANLTTQRHVTKKLRQLSDTTGATGAAASTVAAAATSTSAVFVRQMTDAQLPASVDYRGLGEDGPGVKDQIACGSCWTFSAVGAMQGAWYRATGQSLSFSEQQLHDCSWNYGNYGCLGGYPFAAIQYAVDAGGMAQEGDLPYRDQDTYCRTGLNVPADTSDSPAPVPEGVALPGRFSGYLNITSRDEGALMEALVRFGPVSVTIYASPAFSLYAEGVWFDPTCDESPAGQNHAVTLVGYGTTDDGLDYWLIKNSWSKLWGVQGYGRVTRKVNDCGITTAPVVAIVDPVAAAAAVAAASGR